MSALNQFCLTVSSLIDQFEIVRAEMAAMPVNTPTQLQDIMDAVKAVFEAGKTIDTMATAVNTLYNDTAASVAEAVETFDKQVSTLRNALKAPTSQNKIQTQTTNITSDTQMTYAAKVSVIKQQSTYKVGSNVSVVRDQSTKRYEIASGVTISAYSIHGADSCKSFPGWLCYNDEDERFYISINGHTIGAITTDILDGSIRPVKFHELLPGRPNASVTDCQFYVAAADYPGSKDRRILTNRAIYVPAAEVPKAHEKFVYRIGSRAHLKDDLNHMQKSDYRMLNDQTGNFLLCLIAAADLLSLMRF